MCAPPELLHSFAPPSALSAPPPPPLRPPASSSRAFPTPTLAPSPPPHPQAITLAEKYPERIVLGTTVRGTFLEPPSKEFGEDSYEIETAHLKKFAAQIETRAGAKAGALLRYGTACGIYGIPLPKGATSHPAPCTPSWPHRTHCHLHPAPHRTHCHTPHERPASYTILAAHTHTPSDSPPPLHLPKMTRGCTLVARALVADPALSEKLKVMEKGKTLKSALQTLKDNKSFNTKEAQAASFLAALAYGGSASSATVCPPSLTDKKWDTIDCHLHLLDFLQKSSGTTAALKAMDGCDCKKAVLFGMPCCKKWCFYRPEQPLYYQVRNLAAAPAFHALLSPSPACPLWRLYYKYPNMWRGIGEIMCRHDDLTTMLLGKEIPRVNHKGLEAIYEFAIEVDIPCLVHHNADRVGDKDGDFEYIHEVKEVLKKCARGSRPFGRPWPHARHALHPHSRSEYSRCARRLVWQVPEAQVRVGARGRVAPLLRARPPQHDLEDVRRVRQPQGRHLLTSPHISTHLPPFSRPSPTFSHLHPLPARSTSRGWCGRM